MPKKSIKAEINTFVKGLITEASPLNFPADASTDEENFELNRDGSRQRRKGFSFEPGYGLITATGLTESNFNQATPTTFKWSNVNNNTDNTFAVVQANNNLYIFNMSAGVLSTSGYLATVALTGFPTAVQYSLASVDGYLIVAAGIDTIAIVSYNGTSFTVTYERLKVRDVWGVEVNDTNIETDALYRPPSGTLASIPLNTFHHYNLQNQSWGITRFNTFMDAVDPIYDYAGYVGTNKYPSNSEVVWAGMQFVPSSSNDPKEAIYPRLYNHVFGASTSTPKGYFIIDALRRGQSRQEQVVSNNNKFPTLRTYTFSAKTDLTPGGAKYVQQYSGRIFYAGFSGSVIDGDSRSPNMSNFILFSQLVKNRQDFVKCYQEGDPTSRESSDLVDTDGGFIKLSGANNILGMVNYGTYLIVIASNGVWAISGGNDSGFGATNYKSEKISAFGGISSSSIVEDGNRVFFWSDDGIYVITRDNIAGVVVNNITQSTIQTLYQNIDNVSKKNCVAVYDALNKTIRWIYKTSATRFSASSITYELIFNTVINAFYKNRIYNPLTNDGEIVGAISASQFSSSNNEEDIAVLGDSVVVSTVPVVIPDLTIDSGIQSIRYLAFVKSGSVLSFTFGYLRDTQFRDWPQLSPVDAKAFLVTGSITGGDSGIEKQVPYLTMHMKRTEFGVDVDGTPNNKSGCLVGSRWDFSDSTNSNRWSNLFQAYRYRKPYLISGPSDTYDNGYDLITTKNKLRGRGRAVSLYMETEPLKDCKIIGWNLALNGNQYT